MESATNKRKKNASEESNAKRRKREENAFIKKQAKDLARFRKAQDKEYETYVKKQEDTLLRCAPEVLRTQFASDSEAMRDKHKAETESLLRGEAPLAIAHVPESWHADRLQDIHARERKQMREKHIFRCMRFMPMATDMTQEQIMEKGQQLQSDLAVFQKGQQDEYDSKYDLIVLEAGAGAEVINDHGVVIATGLSLEEKDEDDDDESEQDDDLNDNEGSDYELE